MIVCIDSKGIQPLQYFKAPANTIHMIKIKKLKREKSRNIRRLRAIKFLLICSGSIACASMDILIKFKNFGVTSGAKGRVTDTPLAEKCLSDFFYKLLLTHKFVLQNKISITLFHFCLFKREF